MQELHRFFFGFCVCSFLCMYLYIHICMYACVCVKLAFFSEFLQLAVFADLFVQAMPTNVNLNLILFSCRSLYNNLND